MKFDANKLSHADSAEFYVTMQQVVAHATNWMFNNSELVDSEYIDEDGKCDEDCIVPQKEYNRFNQYLKNCFTRGYSKGYDFALQQFYKENPAKDIANELDTALNLLKSMHNLPESEGTALNMIRETIQLLRG